MKRLIAVIIAVVLLFSVATFAHADLKVEATLTVQLLQEKVRRLQFEFTVTMQDLNKARAKLQAIIDKENKEAKEKKK